MNEAELRQKFKDTYGPEPSAVIRVPGSLTLIGDHTDYSNLPVLGVAIDRWLHVAAGPSPLPGLVAESTAFPGRVMVDERGRASSGGWGRYLSALVGEAGNGSNLALSIDSEIPMGAGLGSSTALLTGVAAAIDSTSDRLKIAAIAASAEQRVGVESSGSTERILAVAQANTATRLDFDPARETAVPFPADWRLVSASSGEEGASEQRQRMYYERIVGARMASALLAEMVGTEPNENLHLGDIAGADVVDILAEELPGKAMIKDVARTTGVVPARLGQLSHLQFETQVSIPVRGPAIHILAEAQRVESFEAAMREGNGEAAGLLMTESHNSLREHMACSTQRLDRLCKAMREAGAFGARLTGRGFGGFAVALCSPERLEAVIEAGKSAYGGPAFEVHPVDGWQVL